jgi:polyphosphate glucokinase
MVSEVKKLPGDWMYDVVSIPGPVLRGRPIAEPYKLGRGGSGSIWCGTRLPCESRHDAAMQALVSYKGGQMLFLGLGTGLGSTMIVESIADSMELGHLPYKKGTYEDCVGRAGLERHGKKKWRRQFVDVATRHITALEPDDTVLGGGNVKKLDELPPHCRAGDNANAFRGGFRLWGKEHALLHTRGRSKQRA